MLRTQIDQQMLYTEMVTQNTQRKRKEEYYNTYKKDYDDDGVMDPRTVEEKSVLQM